jgi:hypothetical protein
MAGSRSTRASAATTSSPGGGKVREQRRVEHRASGAHGHSVVAVDTDQTKSSSRLSGEAATGCRDVGLAEDPQEANDGIAHRRHHLRCAAPPHLRPILVEGHVADPMRAIFNGLITNDKICFVRASRLTLGRSSRRREYDRIAAPVLAYPPGESGHQEGSDEAAVAHPAATAPHAGRTTALGSRLSAGAALGRASHGGSDHAERASESRGGTCE